MACYIHVQPLSVKEFSDSLLPFSLSLRPHRAKAINVPSFWLVVRMFSISEYI